MLNGTLKFTVLATKRIKILLGICTPRKLPHAEIKHAQLFSFFQDHTPDVDHVPGEKMKHLDTQ